MANYIVKSADIDFGETIYIPMSNDELREAKLVKRTYDTESLKYHFVVAGLEEQMIVSEPQGNGYSPKKFFRNVDDAFNGITIPLKTINLADKLFEAGFNINDTCSKVVMVKYKDFKLIPAYIDLPNAKLTETKDEGINVEFMHYKTIIINGIKYYQYENEYVRWDVFKSNQDALKAKPISIYRF